MSTILPTPNQAAMSLAERGFRVFPIVGGLKIPAIDAWQLSATTDPDRIRNWFICSVTGWEQPLNVGIATGQGLVALDVDQKQHDGGAELAKLSAEHSELPETLTAVTPTGGRHLFFRSKAPISNSASKIAPGLDVRGWHGYVVAAPSEVDQGAYAWANEAPIAPCPVWLEQLMVSASRAEAKERKPVEVDIELDRPEALEWARTWLETAEVAIEGAGGNDAAYRVAQRVKDLGLSEPACLDVLLEVWNERCAPPWPADELATVVAHAYSYGHDAPGSKSPEHLFSPILALPWVAASSFADSDPPERRWLVRDWIPAGEVTLLNGHGGTGKSLIAQQLATCVVAGVPWLGCDVPERGKAYALMSEDDEGELHRRQRSITAAAFAELSDLKNLHLLSRDALAQLRDGSALMVFSGDSGQGELTPFFRNLHADVTASEGGLVVLDTKLDLFSGRNNNAEQARAFVRECLRRLTERGAAVVLIDHVSQAGMVDGSQMSGSYQWHNAVRSRLSLEKSKINTDRLLTAKKSNYGPDDQKIRLQWVNGVYREIDATMAELEAVSVDSLYLELLEKLLAQGENPNPSKNAASYAPKLMAARGGHVYNVEDLEAAQQRLLDSGLISIKRYGKGDRAMRLEPASIGTGGRPQEAAGSPVGGGTPDTGHL